MRALVVSACSIALGASAQTLVPVQICQLDSVLQEASGLLQVDGALWVVLDSGNPSALFQVDPVSGAVVRTLAVTNAVNTDWEDLAMDETWVYIGDFGNNAGDRTNLRIYRIPRLALEDEGVTETLADTIGFAYADQTDFTTAPDANNWDCEAFIAHGDSLYLFSKNWLTSDCFLYTLPSSLGDHLAERRDTLDAQGLITGASLKDGEGAIALMGYTSLLAPFVWWIGGYAGDAFFEGITQRHQLDAWPMQGEGIAWTGPDSVVLCSEAFGPFPGRLWSLGLMGPSRVDEPSATRPFDVFPNPANGWVRIPDDMKAGRLMAADGRPVKHWQATGPATTIDLADSARGIYLLQENGTGRSVRLVISR